MSKTLKFSNGDMVRSGSNQGYDFISGRLKCKQDVELMLTSDVRSSTGLGCGLDSVIGSDTMADQAAYSSFPAVFDFQTKVRQGMEQLMASQRSYDYSERTRDELIYSYTPASVVPSQSDFRNFSWAIDVITEDGMNAFTISGDTGV